MPSMLMERLHYLHSCGEWATSDIFVSGSHDRGSCANSPSRIPCFAAISSFHVEPATSQGRICSLIVVCLQRCSSHLRSVKRADASHPCQDRAAETAASTPRW